MLKLLGVGGLILIMLIPLLMIEGVLSDRLARRNEAVADITDIWTFARDITSRDPNWKLVGTGSAN